MRKSTKFAAVAAGVIAIGAAYFADNIRGYYRFKEICEAEGGLRVLHPLQRGVGWFSPQRGGGLDAAAFRGVAFVRFQDAGGARMDYRYRAGPIRDLRSYQATPADESKPTIYEIRSVNEGIPSERRTSRSGYEVTEIATGRLMLRWYQIGYSTFNQDRTLFAAPSGQACHRASAFFDPVNQAKYFSE